MSIKTKIKNGPLFPLLIYLQYFIKRYFIRWEFRSFKLTKEIKLEAVDKGITFFGYYNISPSNSNGDILYLKVNQENVRGSLVEAASIMLKNANGTISKITETKAWNWQQGCMLQWHPSNNNQIIFNDYDAENDCYISKIIDTTGKVLKVYDKPVNNVSKTGTYALSLNYDRLAVMRPDYGYFNRNNPSLPDNKNDGIWHIDFNTDQIKLIITLDQLINLSWSPTMEGAMHKVNHIDINPLGTRFMFQHRWKGPKGRFMRLIIANPDGSNLKILNGDIMTSHSCWLNNSEILSFCNYNGKVGYFKFNIQTSEVQFFSDKMPMLDGHPSISPDGKWIVTDTYPDKARFSSLYLYNMGNDSIKKIGEFYQPLRYKKEMRIDLHPKWGAGGNEIIIESGHCGKRQLFAIKLN